MPTSETGSPSTAIEFENLFTSRSSGDTEQQLSIRGLISVPDYLRKLDEQAFTPLLISIGPIHHSNVKLQTMNKYKKQLCFCFIQRVENGLQNLLHLIKGKEKEIRSYYEETIVSSIKSDDFVEMIVTDGTFILEYFLRQSKSYLVKSDPSTVASMAPVIVEWMAPFLKLDLVLLENQLPFFVLEMLFEKANIQVELQELAFEFLQCYNFQKKALNQLNEKIEHLTDLVRFFYLRGGLQARGFGGAKLSYSAAQLHKAGVKLKGLYTGSRSFLDIKFNSSNGVLEIPCITLSGETVRLFRNIIALEQSLYVGHAYVTDYFVILNCLINTSKDVDLLCDKGILINYLGDSKVVTSVVNNINPNILSDYMNSNYLELCRNLNAYYNASWHKWKTMMWRQYVRNPWETASISAAILLLLTIVQTVCALKSTKW